LALIYPPFDGIEPGRLFVRRYDSDNIPESIGRYQLLTRLAVGGMAEIFLACERGMGGLERTVVIKRILPHLATNPSFVDMFLREARIIARLTHPNIVQIYELGEAEGDYYIAMEYIHGSTVRELQLLSAQHGDGMPLNVAVGIMSQACRGAHAAHELTDLEGKMLGVIHRDISPHNLMVTGSGNLKLLDFGVAKGTTGAEETYSGSLKGKFAYMSPEQCRHDDLDRRSDVFALGIILWELCTGRKLYKRDNELKMLKAITEEAAPPPSEYNDQVPMLLDFLVLKALARDRQDRFVDAKEMRLAIEDLASSLKMDVGQDTIASFVTETAGEYLTERGTIVQEALDRSLDSAERRRLLHVTASKSVSEEDIDTVATQAMAKSGAPASDTGLKARDEVEVHPAFLGTDTIPKMEPLTVVQEPSFSRRGVLVAVLAFLILVGGGTASLHHLTNGTWNLGAIGVEPDAAVDESDVLAIEPPPKLTGEPLPFGWAPTVDPEILRKELDVLHKYMERELRRPVPLIITDDYGDLSRRLQSGEVAIAALPPLLFTRAKLAEPKIRALVIKEFDGAHRSDGYLLVQQKSKVTQLAQLNGKRFCFTDANSTTGYFLPRAYFRANGFDPETFVGQIYWSGDHTQLLRDLLADKCDAGATYSGGFLTAGDLGVLIGQIRLLAVTGFVPQDAITAGPNVPAEDQQAVARVLLAFDPVKHLGIESLGKSQRITGFAQPDMKPFDMLREMVLSEDREKAKSSKKKRDAGEEVD